MPLDNDDMPSFAPAPASNSAAFSPLEIAAEQTEILAKWLADHPVIQSEEEAREAKIVYDRGYNAKADLEAVKEKEVTPLHTAWQNGLAKYRQPVASITTAVKSVWDRMQDWLKKEQDRKIDEAEAARKAAFVAEMAARQVEAAEREAKENASQGEVGVDVVAATAQADSAFADYKHADRDAARAMQATEVRVSGGIGRAIGIRREKVLILDDGAKALAALGVTEDIRTAILKSARAYKKLNNKWPDGVHEEEK